MRCGRKKQNDETGGGGLGGSSHLERFGVTPSGLKRGNVCIRCLYSAICIDGYGFNETRREEEEESFHEGEHFPPFFSLSPPLGVAESQYRKLERRGGSFEGRCRCVCARARRYTSSRRIHGGGSGVKRGKLVRERVLQPFCLSSACVRAVVRGVQMCRGSFGL